MKVHCNACAELQNSNLKPLDRNKDVTDLFCAVLCCLAQIDAVLLEGHCGTNSKYQGLYNREPTRGKNGFYSFVRASRVDGLTLQLFYNTAQCRWSVVAKGRKTSLFFSNVVQNTVVPVRVVLFLLSICCGRRVLMLYDACLSCRVRCIA